MGWTQQLAVVDQERKPLKTRCGVWLESPVVCRWRAGLPDLQPFRGGGGLATRSLLWGYVYKPSDAAEATRPPGSLCRPLPVTDPEPGSRWANAPVILAEGRVVVTPADSGEVHCLNLIDGARRSGAGPGRTDCFWPGDQGKVILAGRRSVWALKFSDGWPAWDGRTVQLAGGSSPSGTGFFSGSHYYLPL